MYAGGNKNEFIYCIGVDSYNKINWCHIISWSQVEILKIEAKNFVNNMKHLDLIKLGEYTQTAISTKFIKRDFRKFDYLSVNISTKYMIVALILIAMLNGIVCIYIIMNEINP